MASNTLGTLLTLTSFGESHGEAIGGILDGMPAGISIDTGIIASELMRRSTSRNLSGSGRREADHPEILSGLFEGRTTGMPIGFILRNTDARPGDYETLRHVFRPSHADAAYTMKYGIRDHRGGGRSSARETATWVIAGSMVRQWLASEGISIQAYVSAIGDIRLENEPATPDPDGILASEVACPDPSTSLRMLSLLEDLRKEGDTAGGVITGQITGLPLGLGEPVFRKFHATLGQAMLSINACKGFEIGEGFRAASMRGSQHNDPISGLSDEGSIHTLTNHAGGVLGGITNGMPVIFRAAFKPVASIRREQRSITRDGSPAQLEIRGRHDVCVVPRAVPVVEAMAALVTGDMLLQSRARHAH